MANTKSATKAAAQADQRRQRNMHYKRTMRTKVKQVRAAIQEADAETARAALQDAARTIRRSASKGIIHVRTASRQISRLTKAVNAIVAQG